MSQQSHITGDRVCLKPNSRSFPGGPVIENLPSSTGQTSLIPGQGTKIPHATGQQASPAWQTLRSPCTKRRAGARPLRPNTINKGCPRLGWGRLPAVREARVWALGWDLLEKGRLPTPGFSPGKSRDCTVHGATKSQTQLSNLHSQPNK